MNPVSPVLTSNSNDAAWADLAWNRTITKLTRTSQRIDDTFPHVSRQGRYDSAAPQWWTAGFWPGLLWLAYRDTQDKRFSRLAESCELKLDAVLQGFDTLDHDTGFIWSLTSVARYKLLGGEESRRRALHAASILASRFNLSGRFIRAWNFGSTGWAIIDCMMNLPLLYWASETIGDPRFAHIANAHAETVLKHFLRADGSSRHIVSFDPQTGAFIEALGGQGYAPDSAWARGASWALHGFALAYRYTRLPQYLEASRRVADFFLASLPADGVPPWDFRAPQGPDTPLDSSAGACAASGLLELARLVPAADAEKYRKGGEDLVRALDRKCGAWDQDEEGLLLHATGHKPEGSNIDVPLIYGDYYFVEALSKLRGHVPTFW